MCVEEIMRFIFITVSCQKKYAYISLQLSHCTADRFDNQNSKKMNEKFINRKISESDVYLIHSSKVRKKRTKLKTRKNH